MVTFWLVLIAFTGNSTSMLHIGGDFLSMNQCENAAKNYTVHIPANTVGAGVGTICIQAVSGGPTSMPRR